MNISEYIKTNYPLMDKYIEDYGNAVFNGNRTLITAQSYYIFHRIYGAFNNQYRYILTNGFGTIANTLDAINSDFTINVIIRNNSTVSDDDARALNDKGYAFNTLLTKYIRKTWRTVSIYTNEAKHSSIVVTGKTVSIMELTTVLLSISEKLYNVSLTDEQHLVLKALYEANTDEQKSDELKDVLESWVENVVKLKVHIETVGELFAKYIEKNRKSKATAIEGEIQRLSARIREIEEEYQRALDMIESESRNYEAALATSKEQVKDLQMFIDTNKAIYNVAAHANGEITFFIKTFLTNFDSAAIDAMLNNRNSFINQQWSQTYPELIDFIRFAFGSKRVGKVRVCSQYTISNNCVRVNSRYSLDNDCVGNGHHFFYACLGSNNLELDKYFRNGDFESMFEYAIACTSTENVNEAASFNRFLEAFLTSWKNKKCVEYKGEDYTWPDFVKKVKDEQSNSQQ